MTETATSVEERTSSAVHPGDLTEKLVECREKAGLDIQQAAEELHLSATILRALEAEDFAHLPEPPYVRGYLRGYSKFADVDAKDLIRTYEALRGAKPDEIAHHFAPARPLSKVAQPIISTSTLKFIGFGALVLLLGLFSTIPGVRDWANHTWSSFSAQTNPPDVPRPPSAMEAYAAQKEAMEHEKDQAATQQAAAAKAATPTPETTQPATAASTQDSPVVATADNTNVTPEQPSPSPTPATQAAAVEATPAPAATTNTDTATADPNASAAASAVDTPIAPGEINIKMEFSEEVWMQIKGDDKKTLFESLNTAGNIKEFKATPPLNVKIGNAPGVKIFVNGQPFELAPHTKGSVARFRVE